VGHQGFGSFMLITFGSIVEHCPVWRIHHVP
jgi:hypothetical protein